MERSSWNYSTRLTGRKRSLGLILAYLIVFPPLEILFGPSLTTLVALPVGVVTWYFGLTMGLVAGLMGVSFNIAFLVVVEKFDLAKLTYFGLIPRPLMLAALVAIVYLLRKQSIGRERVTDALHARESFLTSLNQIIGGLM